MVSVTQRIKQITQPRGGYLKLSEFEKQDFYDNEILKEENIHSNLVGMAVDYLTRLMLGTPVEEAFKNSLLGAKIIREEKKANSLLKKIKGLDKSSIYYACKLVGYDVCLRVGPVGYKKVDEIEADNDTINNIRIMVERSISFFNKYGPVVKDGVTFEGGYTNLVDSGDGDFLTADTLWDFKVSKNDPTSAHTLQLLVYYIMGMHSIDNKFKNIIKLGIFNPRKNCIYIKNILDIPQTTINEISYKVIGYKENSTTQNEAELSENEDMLSMTEIMKALSCTRYMVIKYYSEKGLPLVKVNNKYFISKQDLSEWITQKEKERQIPQTISLIFSIITLIAVIIGLIYIFKNFKI